MNDLLRFSFLTLLLIGFVKSGVLPVEKCSLQDSVCMTKEFQKALPTFIAGVPELGTDVLDVLEIDDFAFDLSGLQFSLKEGRLKGLKGSVFDNVQWDMKKKRLSINFHVDCTMKGHYIAAGRILILPITGDGQMKLKMRNVHINLYIDYEIEKGADSKDHVVPKKNSFEFDVKDNAQFGLTNLFNGNKELSDPLIAFLNENWKQISLEFGRPVMDAVAKKVFKNLKIFFEKQALEDIASV